MYPKIMTLLLSVSFGILLLTFEKGASASKQEKLTNKHLVIAASSWPPYVELTKGADGKIQVEGFIWEVVKFWLYARNFTYSVVRQNTFGWCHKPNNCTGLLGMVNRKEVDFALGKYQYQRLFNIYISKE